MRSFSAEQNPPPPFAQEKQQRKSNLTTVVSMTWLLRRFAYLTLMQNVRGFGFLPSARDVAKTSARGGR